MSLRSDIRAALDARLDTVPGIAPAARRHTENATGFTVPIGQPWVRVQLRFSEEQLLTLPADGGLVEVPGRLSLELRFPQETGSAAGDTVAQAVLDHFPQGMSLVVGAGGHSLQVDRRRAWGGANEGNLWYMVPVDLNWYLRTINPL